MSLNRNQKIGAIAVSLVLVAGAIWAFIIGTHDYVAQHADRFFFSEAQAQSLTDEVRKAANAARDASQAASETSRSLAQYVQRQELKTAKERLQVLKGQLSETQLWEASNGVNDISRARKRDLQIQLDELTGQITCMETGRLDCG